MAVIVIQGEGFIPNLMCPQMVPMVRGKQHQGIPVQSQLRQLIQNAAHHVINQGALTHIFGDQLLPVLPGEPVSLPVLGCVMLHRWLAGHIVIEAGDGLNVLWPVHGGIGLWDHAGEMRPMEVQPYKERLFLLRKLLNITNGRFGEISRAAAL